MKHIFSGLTQWILGLYKSFCATSSHSARRASFFVLFITTGTFFLAHPALANAKTSPDFIDWLLMIAGNIAIMIATVLSQLVVYIIGLLLPVMSYNNFTNSAVVNAGWALVRDTVNMFFVVVLIIIAFGTIFGHSKFQWQQQVPKLLIFAIVINFSKTLCGIMIDFGQVIMLTFANAIQQIAAGNFAQLLGFTEIYAVGVSSSSMQSAAGGQGGGIGAFDYFASGLMSVFMMLIIVGVMLMLLAILIYRVIMLWIMIVLAPLTWFVGGAKDIINSNAYAQWWERFKCLVAVGPVLTFFLWLTLAVAGAGNIAATSGFDMSGGNANPGGMINKIFEQGRLMSFVIGIAMLVAGFEAAQQICSAMTGSFLGKALKGGPAKAAARVGAMVAKPAVKAGRLGLKGGRAAGRATLRSTPVGRKVSRGMRGLAKKTGSGLLGRTLGRTLEKGAGGIDRSRRDAVAKHSEKYAGDTREQKLNQLKRLSEGGSKTVLGKRDGQALFQEALKDPQMMKQLRAGGNLKGVWDKFGKSMEQDFAGDSEMTDKLTAFKKQNADVTGSAHLLNNSDDFKSLSLQALTDEEVKKKAENTSSGMRGEIKDIDADGKEVSRMGTLSVAQAMKEGLYGADKKDVFENGSSALYSRMGDQELSRVGTGDLVANGSADVLSRAASHAVKTDNTSRLESIMTGLTHAIEEEQNSEKKFELNSTFDNVKATVADNSVGLDRGSQSRMESVLAKANANRDSSLLAGGSFDAGTLPQLADKENPSAFIEDSFRGADIDRLGSGVEEQIAAQIAAATSNIESKESNLNSDEQVASDQLERLTDELRRSREQARNKLEIDKKAGQQQGQIDSISAARDASDDIGERISMGDDIKGLEASIKALNVSVDNQKGVKDAQKAVDTQKASDKDGKASEISDLKSKLGQMVEAQAKLKELQVSALDKFQKK